MMPEQDAAGLGSRITSGAGAARGLLGCGSGRHPADAGATVGTGSAVTTAGAERAWATKGSGMRRR